MDRRSLLQLAVAAVGATAIVNDAGGQMSARAAARRPGGQQRESASFVKSPDGTNLFFRDWGSGRHFVFLAPWRLHSGWWEYQMAHLTARGARCVAYDRRGHGRSDETTGGYNFDVLADDLASVVEQLDLHDVTLVGQSLGCGEMVRYLSRYSGPRVTRVVFIAPITPQIVRSPSNPQGVDSDYLEKVRAVLSADRPKAIAESAPAFFGAPQNAVSTEMMAWWTDMLMKCSLRVLLELHKVFTVTDFSAELSKVRLPTLIIHGDNDTSTPIEFTGRKTANLIRGSRLTVYAGAAHGLPITHMDRLNRDLLEFS